MNLDNNSEETLDAIKNLIAVETEPDLFLLFKVIQALDESNENIGLLKSVTIFKSKIYEIVNELTKYKFTILSPLKRCNRFEVPFLMHSVRTITV